MCGDHEMLPLPEWLQELIVPVRCMPAIGIHEGCEHDREQPSFEALVRQDGF